MNKFQEIAADLEHLIVTEHYPARSLLPSENQLMNQYGVSRETVRKALNLLITGGFIQKKQGKGSIVLDVQRFHLPVTGVTSYKELQAAQHFQSETTVVEIYRSQVPEWLAEKTDWQKADSIWVLTRQRKVRGEAIILDRDYLIRSIIPELPVHEAENSIYRYFEEDLDLKIGFAQKEITVEEATSEDREWLDIGEDSHVVVVRSVVHLEDTRVFEYTESRHRLDKFKFVDFARRKRLN